MGGRIERSELLLLMLLMSWTVLLFFHESVTYVRYHGSVVCVYVAHGYFFHLQRQTRTGDAAVVIQSGMMIVLVLETVCDAEPLLRKGGVSLVCCCCYCCCCCSVCG